MRFTPYQRQRLFIELHAAFFFLRISDNDQLIQTDDRLLVIDKADMYTRDMGMELLSSSQQQTK